MKETAGEHQNMGKEIRKKKVRIPPVSNYPSRKEWEIAVWKMVVRSPDILDILMTPNECHDLVMRAAVTEGIRLGKSYREIGDELWCSPQTISGIKKALQKKKYQSYWERGKTERKKKVYSAMSHSTLASEPRKRVRGKYTGPIQLSGISRTHYPEKRK